MIRRLLDLLPHDTLYVGGHVYMRRWYVFGYAPDPEHPDKRMICATCRRDVLLVGDRWVHSYDGIVGDVHVVSEDETGIKVSGALRPQPHPAVGVSAERPGWWWRDHGLGAVRVHEIVASDDSRAFHDHPWPFVSILLRGSYVEEVPAEVHADGRCDVPGEPANPRRRFTAPTTNRHRATDLHVLNVDRGPVWTLFLSRPKVRSWGFAGPFGWLPWRTFDEKYPERDAWTG